MFLKNNKGFTLLEVLITFVILVLVFALIGPLFITGLDFFGKSNNMVMDQANLRRTMTDMSREIRDATIVNVISSSEIEIGNCIYKYEEDESQITKTYTDSGTVNVVSNRVELFEIIQNDDVIQFTVRAMGAGSTIVTKVSIRQRVMPTPDVG
ncbi:MAG: prepilin-type N-terminal cleavage/methylation domain-containing protein [Eubacteriales bacterium]